jgi:hypothetical protein
MNPTLDFFTSDFACQFVSSPFYSPDRGAGGVLSLGRGSPLRLFIAISERIWVGAGG